MKKGEQYQHYKGTLYQIVAIATHTEDLTEYVIYQDVEHPEKIWARPRAMFEETVQREGKEIERFKRIE